MLTNNFLDIGSDARASCELFVVFLDEVFNRMLLFLKAGILGDLEIYRSMWSSRNKNQLTRHDLINKAWAKKRFSSKEDDIDIGSEIVLNNGINQNFCK